MLYGKRLLTEFFFGPEKSDRNSKGLCYDSTIVEKIFKTYHDRAEG